jgi:hypothetical protein
LSIAQVFFCEFFKNNCERLPFYESDKTVAGQITFRYAQKFDQWPEIPEMPTLPVWTSQEPVLRPVYGLFGLLEDTLTSETRLAKQ